MWNRGQTRQRKGTVGALPAAQACAAENAGGLLNSRHEAWGGKKAGRGALRANGCVHWMMGQSRSGRNGEACQNVDGVGTGGAKWALVGMHAWGEQSARRSKLWGAADVAAPAYIGRAVRMAACAAAACGQAAGSGNVHRAMHCRRPFREGDEK